MATAEERGWEGGSREVDVSAYVCVNLGLSASEFTRGHAPRSACVARVCPTWCARVWSQLIAGPAARMNDSSHRSQTVESSPVNVGYLKTDGHLEAIGAQL